MMCISEKVFSHTPEIAEVTIGRVTEGILYLH